MKALVLINLQNDFGELGALGVAGADAVVARANALMPRYEWVVAVRDWHPAEHVSFASSHLWRRPGQLIRIGEREQLLWQMHCVQGSFGAEFVGGLRTDLIQAVFSKGMDAGSDSYSGFYVDAQGTPTGLEAWLRERGVGVLHLLGLLADYDVKYTALDAKRLGFDVVIY